ncbi:MAG: hypothetical protein JXQ79_06070 [Rhodobacteraceae bacterium]|nr:hypothetical protein [Paracoccaceae bacterium]
MITLNLASSIALHACAAILHAGAIACAIGAGAGAVEERFEALKGRPKDTDSIRALLWLAVGLSLTAFTLQVLA